MRERRRDYEMMFIISPLHSSEEGVTATIDRVKHAITSEGGEVKGVEQTSPWGRRKLAYPIREYAGGEASRRNFAEGYYVLMHFSLASSKVTVLDRAMKLNDPVLRHLVTVVEHVGQIIPETVERKASVEIE